jgi:hypothetical protein
MASALVLGLWILILFKYERDTILDYAKNVFSPLEPK